MNRYGIIYKITNTVNNKVYIGQTTSKRGFKKRYQAVGEGIEKVYNFYKNKEKLNKGYWINKHLVASIEKYGFDAFEVDEEFYIAFTKEDLDTKEKEFIKIYDCINNGYNHQDGGNATPPTQQIKNKLIKLKSKPICQYSLEGIFIKEWPSIKVAVEQVPKTSSSNISKCAKGTVKMSGGYLWAYKGEELKVESKSSYRVDKTIYQYDLDGNYIRSWGSQRAFLDSIGCLGNSGSLSNCLNGKGKTAYGFIFRFKPLPVAVGGIA